MSIGQVPPKQAPSSPLGSPQTAPDLLQAAARHMTDRAAIYDAPEGERSMARTVVAFNALTGQHISEAEGWWW